MIKSSISLLFFTLLFSIMVNGQEEVTSRNVQSYTPSVLIGKGATEFKLFNNLYTQTQFFDASKNKINDNNRSTYFTAITEVNYGVSSKVTLGGELWFKSVKIDNKNSNPLGVLTFTNSSTARTAVSGLGLKVKFNPIKKWARLSIQTVLIANVLKDPESKKINQPFLDNNRHQWVTKIYYDKKFGEKFNLFTQFSTWVNIDKELGKEDTGVAIPLDVFASYFATSKLTFYIQNQLWPSLGNDGLSSYFLQEGLGIKYQLFSGVELEGLYTQFLLGKNSGAGQTFNLGVRILN
ncbi:MAG: hypothetical protein J5I47_03515 [Vicingus serpentipes]|nr:hypothetical protein [Vicingus serpentipes]